jgi:hypothetical protein
MTTISYTIIDDKYNVEGKDHVSLVNATIYKYLSMFGNTGQMTVLNYPRDITQEAALFKQSIDAAPDTTINNSWSSFSLIKTAGAMLYYKPDVYQVYKSAFEAGKTLVFAAGNFGAFKPLSMSFESSLPFSLNISAMDETHQISSYSSVNPGITNYIADGSIQYMGQTYHGTSFAAPRVTALVAMLQDKYQHSLDNSEIHTILDLASKGELMTISGHPEIAGSYYHVIDDSVFAKALNSSYVPGTIDNKVKVSALYELVLNRVADDEGLAYWTAIADKQGIGAVFNSAKGYAQHYSEEGVSLFDKVQDLYHLFLGREADDKGMAWWLDVAMQTQRPSGDQIYNGGHVWDMNAMIKIMGDSGLQLPEWWGHYQINA